MTITDEDLLYNEYDAGQMVRIFGSCRDETDQPHDPGELELRYKDPDTGVVTSVTWPTDTEVVRDGTGEFHSDIDTTGFNDGTWYYKWTATGPITAAQQFAFIIRHGETS